MPRESDHGPHSVSRAPHTLRVRAFAKVNLDLRVLGRRADGYHDLRTIFQTVALHDTLSFSPARGPLLVSASGEEIPTDDRNIVWKAARALWRADGRRGEPRGLSVRIVKRIPVQAGLGGGSSDAAVTLRVLDRLWHIGLTELELHRIAAALGADVPFFLMGGTVLGLGRGDQLYPLPALGPSSVVIARPSEGVSTAAAYGWLATDDPGPARVQRLGVSWPPGSLDVANDFERVVLPRVPGTGRLRRALASAGADLAMLSGSGSAVFGVFSHAGGARRAAERLRAAGTDVWVTRFQARSRGALAGR